MMTESTSSGTASDPDGARPGTMTFRDHLLAESLQALESGAGGSIDDHDANEAAARVGGSFQQRVRHRARALAGPTGIGHALDQTRHATTWLVLLAMMLAALAGAGAARAVLGGSDKDSINVYWVLVNLLGLQTIMGVVWIIAMSIRPRSAPTFSLGGLLLTGLGAAGRALFADSKHHACLRAIGSTYRTTSVARWSLSSLSHLCWIAFNVGSIVLLVLLLSTRSYRFGWETTILSEDTYAPMTRAIASVPNAVGFNTPDDEQIAASRLDTGTIPPESTSVPWSSFVIGSLVMYGLVPRVVLGAGCGLLLVRARRRVVPDLTLPGYARLRPLIMPDSQRTGVVIPEEPHERALHRSTKSEVVRGDASAPGPPSIAGIELQLEGVTWPPSIDGVAWVDLGNIESRSDRQVASAALAAQSPASSHLVLVCDVRTTPDRGVATVLRNLRDAATGQPRVLLSGGHVLRERDGSASLSERIADWRSMLASEGFGDDAILEVDLAHLTDATRSQIRAAVGGTGATTSQRTRRIEPAIALILDHAGRWDDAAGPSLEDQQSLNAAIVRLHGDDPSVLRRVLGIEGDVTAEAVVERVRDGARHVVSQMPASMRVSPRWIAAGAVVGALGCVTAAALISPVAIGSLPLWSGIGAAISAVCTSGRSRPDGSVDNPDQAGHEFEDAIRAGALIAVLLEIQYLDETAISGVLDGVFGSASDDDGSIRTHDEASAWLKHVRHRFDAEILVLERGGHHG